MLLGEQETNLEQLAVSIGIGRVRDGGLGGAASSRSRVRENLDRGESLAGTT
jgi:hypothetical protein